MKCNSLAIAETLTLRLLLARTTPLLLLLLPAAKGKEEMEAEEERLQEAVEKVDAMAEWNRIGGGNGVLLGFKKGLKCVVVLDNATR